ncbi:sugar phosphate isomerase/epimerase family protein [Gallibacterium anatis]|uniref:Xylose isomerase n=1 Tax=Gallibacterium anatis TaxID=750 RepID=A0A0A2XFJ6_9PAST|nr:sugar phosphate isomerase/epimerase [Gallibacterium anatis]KGQ24127.1 xylose isomerase [Gallibacterium anatis]KGQ29415.1 xylose isomerase [Gallibacterium anatis]KGQ30823.1 xylose isomerase [Gallibacterium anatis]KGQ48128.1 xylose isomerase [Gallibacterium anatis 10672-6]KGQ50008.1 xylose isomerase [Gallibacterium anatis]
MNNNFKLAVNTSIYDGYDLDTIFNSIKKCGFDYFELAYNQGYVGNLNQDLFSKENANYINQLKSKYSLDTFALGCTMDLSVDNLYDIFSPRITFANLIGAKYINVCTTTLENRENLILNLKSLRSLLEMNKCILCIENAGDYNFNAFVDLSDGIKILNELESDLYSINFDPGNMVTYDRKLDVVNQSLNSINYCNHFHIKDVKINNDKFEFVPIGEGIIDYSNIIRKLKENDIVSSLEIPLRIYRELDSTPKRCSDKVDINLIEETLIKSRKYIDNII